MKVNPAHRVVTTFQNYQVPQAAHPGVLEDMRERTQNTYRSVEQRLPLFKDLASRDNDRLDRQRLSLWARLSFLVLRHVHFHIAPTVSFRLGELDSLMWDRFSLRHG